MRTLSIVRVCTFLLAMACLTSAGVSLAEDDAPLWLRHPAVSPDGQTVVFDFRGDLYTMPATGGLATPLTIHEAHDKTPLWSPDGKWVAFASDRYGNWDVFLVPAGGGQVKRLTFHSGADTPCSFTPDGKQVLFTATRLDGVKQAEFPHYRALPELYQVPVDGGRPSQLLTIPAMEAVFDSKQQRLLYSENTSLEDEMRKHNISAFARDIWLWEKKSDRYTKVAKFEGGEFTPVWDADEEGFYYLNERSGDFNIWHMPLDGSGQPRQITKHEKHPVRSLSASRAGDLCYSFDGEIYLKKAADDQGRRIPVIIRTEDPHNPVQHIKLSKGITEIDLSPTGKEIAFINRGEIFVTAVDHDLTKRITDTPEQERSVSFSPDGAGPALRRGARRQLEPLPHRPGPRRRALLLRRHPPEGKTHPGDRGRDLPAGLVSRRQGSGLPRRARHLEGRQPRERQHAHHPAGGQELLLHRRRPVVRVVTGRQVVPGQFPERRTLVQRGGLGERRRQ